MYHSDRNSHSHRHLGGLGSCKLAKFRLVNNPHSEGFLVAVVLQVDHIPQYKSFSGPQPDIMENLDFLLRPDSHWPYHTMAFLEDSLLRNRGWEVECSGHWRMP